MYKGEIDQTGKACGLGYAQPTEDYTVRFNGTFRDDQIHGLCKFFLPHGDMRWHRQRDTFCQ